MLRYLLTIATVIHCFSPCIAQEVEGCADPEAVNYNPNAIHNPDLCVYSPDCEEGLDAYVFSFYPAGFSPAADTLVTYYLTTEDFSDTLGQTSPKLQSAPNWSTQYQNFITACLDPEQCYVFHMSRPEPITPPFELAHVMVEMRINSEPQQEFMSFFYHSQQSESVPNQAVACPVFGCTDSEAMNYNPDATADDGSCTYCTGEMVRVWADMRGTISSQWSIIQDGASVSNGTFSNSTTHEKYICLEEGCYELRLTGSTGNFQKFYVERPNGEIIAEGIKNDLPTARIPFGLNAPPCPDEDEVYGCTNAFANNYNPDATVFDGQCDLDNGECSFSFSFELDTLYNNGVMIVKDVYATDVPWYVFWDFGLGEPPVDLWGPIFIEDDEPLYICTEMISYWSDWFAGGPVIPMCYHEYCEWFYPADWDPEGNGIMLFDEDALSTREEKIAVDVTIYPNPASDIVMLRTGEMPGTFTHLSVISLQGKVLMQQSVSLTANDEHSFNLRNVPAGMYIVALEGPTHSSRIKLVVR